MTDMHSAGIQSKLKDIDDYIRQEYLGQHHKKESDWRTYEGQFNRKMYLAMSSLDPLIHEAVSTLQIEPSTGHSLTLVQKVKVLLIKQLVGESSRMLAGLMIVFSLLENIDVSYETIEGLYSDEEVALAINNLHELIFKKKGIKNI